MIREVVGARPAAERRSVMSPKAAFARQRSSKTSPNPRNALWPRFSTACWTASQFSTLRESLSPFRRSGDLDVPPFERFRNRLKIMAGLDRVLYKEPRTGNLEVVFERASGSACTDSRYSIDLRFIDVGDEPAVEMNARLIATEVFDPDTRL